MTAKNLVALLAVSKAELRAALRAAPLVSRMAGWWVSQMADAKVAKLVERWAVLWVALSVAVMDLGWAIRSDHWLDWRLVQWSA